MTQVKKTSKQVRKVPNPTGKGGFQERPQDRSKGHWNSEDSISFQYNKLMRMTPAELDKFEPQTVAQEIALARITSAKSKTTGLADTKEITDRTEGKAQQSIDLTTGGEAFEPVTVRIINEPSRDTDTE